MLPLAPPLALPVAVSPLLHIWQPFHPVTPPLAFPGFNFTHLQPDKTLLLLLVALSDLDV